MVKSREERLAYQKEWYKRDPEARKKERAEYYAANKERFKAKGREWAVANRERVRENQRKWREANRDKFNKANTKHRLKKLYGITLAERDRMFEAQGRVCKCCSSPDPKASNGWHVDHCHETGRVRGILCQQCNIMLGCAADNPVTLLKGAEYMLLA